MHLSHRPEVFVAIACQKPSNAADGPQGRPAICDKGSLPLAVREGELSTVQGSAISRRMTTQSAVPGA